MSNNRLQHLHRHQHWHQSKMLSKIQTSCHYSDHILIICVCPRRHRIRNCQIEYKGLFTPAIPLNVCAIVMVLWEWKLSKIAKCLKSLNDFKLKFNDVFTLTETEPDAETGSDKWLQNPMALGSRCTMNTSTQFYTTQVYRSQSLLVWTLP